MSVCVCERERIERKGKNGSEESCGIKCTHVYGERERERRRERERE